MNELSKANQGDINQMLLDFLNSLGGTNNLINMEKQSETSIIFTVDNPNRINKDAINPSFVTKINYQDNAIIATFSISANEFIQISHQLKFKNSTPSWWSFFGR